MLRSEAEVGKIIGTEVKIPGFDGCFFGKRRGLGENGARFNMDFPLLRNINQCLCLKGCCLSHFLRHLTGSSSRGVRFTAVFFFFFTGRVVQVTNECARKNR